ncbi:MAG: hypothetical protein RIR24_731 [Actinomycetota bacterium]
MIKPSFKRHWFLVTTVLSLGAGLALSSFELVSNLLLVCGALVGLILSITWTVAAIRSRQFGSDSLALIAIVAAIAVGEYLAAAIVSLMLATGRALEDWAKGKSQRELKSLLDRAPKLAHLVSPDGSIRDVALSEIRIGDRIRVLSGEVVAIDGTLLSKAELDESALTGEPMPVQRLAGEAVASGVVNASSSFELQVTCSAEDSTYSNLIRLVQKASADSAKSVRLANRWALWFVPFTLALAAATFLIGGDIRVAVAVLIAATPCPLILAIPVAVISGMSKAAARGALIKGGEALEILAKAKTVMLDKTGTLTRGGPAVTETAFSPAFDPDQTIRLAASLELHSPHVVARALVAEAERRGLQLLPATEVDEAHGRQITGFVSGQRVTVGQPTEDLPTWAQLGSGLQVAVLINDELAAVLGLDDPIREETIDTIASLRKLGINKIVLVSGDKQKTADEIGLLIGADEIHANCEPADKMQLVNSAMSEGKGAVLLVGDGINDAPALAAASAGIAMGARGATAASEAADVVIIEDSISHLAIAIDISQGAYKKAKQAGTIGMSLAVASMFAAAFGLLNPTQAAITQEFIDAAAILWALTPLRSRLK